MNGIEWHARIGAQRELQDEHSRQSSSENPEVEEIGREDLEAAADIFDRLRSGALQCGCASREVCNHKYIGETVEARPAGEPEMTAEERLALIAETYTHVYCMTESFEKQNIGADLSYLLGSIAKGGVDDRVTFNPRTCRLLKILRGWRDTKNRERALSFIDIE